MTVTHQPLSAQERSAVLAALTDAHTFYHSWLDRSWVPDYLNRRNLYPQIVPARLGYAPGGWTTTRDHLRRQGYADETLEHAGLVRRTSAGGLVDLFRDRLMIPLRTPAGTLVGFSGRAAPIADVTTPKYLNSPASDVFVKHELLLGLAEDADALRAGAMPVIVEGPLDRLAVAQATHALAVVGVTPCGTALSAQQATALLKAVGPRRPIAVMFDADHAGRTATRHAWEVLTDASATHLRHITLPDGKDPAELVRNGRGNLLQDAIYRNDPLAEAVADQTLTAASLVGTGSTARAAGTAPQRANAAGIAYEEWPLDDWQGRLTAARQLFHQDLHRLPAGQIAGYVAHVAERLRLPADMATAAAADAVAAGPSPHGSTAAPRQTGPAPPAPQHRSDRPATQQHCIHRRPSGPVTSW